MNNSHLPVRVLHVFASVQRGGGEQRTLELIRGTDPSRVAHEVLTLSGKTGELQGDFEAAGASVTPLNIRDARFSASFVNYLKRHRIDVVHAHANMHSGPILLLARMAGISRRIAHIRSDGKGKGSSTLLGRLSFLLRRRIIRSNANLIIGVAPSVLEKNFSPHWEANQLFRVVPNGIEVDKYLEAEPLRHLFPGADEPSTRVILHVGRGMPMKNRDRAIRILAHHSVPESMHLAFVGRESPADLEKWTRQTRSLGLATRVHFLGERSDVPRILRSADVLLQTSHYEGLPGVLLEATATSLPVVATRLPGSEYIAARVGNLVLLSLDDDDEAWASALIQQASPDQVGAGHRTGPSIQNSEFDIRHAVEQFTEIWEGRARATA